VEMNNQLVCFSVRDLEDELRPISIYSIINYIWNVVRSERKKRILVIDEAWWLMQSEDSAKFIFALVKRCRKYYLGVTTITQDVNDFLGSSYGKAIVTNSAMQILLKQTPAAVDLIKETFMLTESEKFLLLECGVGEGIFFAGQKHAAIKVVASYHEDQLVTTDPRQLMKINEAKKEFEEELTEAESGGEPAEGETVADEEPLSLASETAEEVIETKTESIPAAPAASAEPPVESAAPAEPESAPPAEPSAPEPAAAPPAAEEGEDAALRKAQEANKE